MKCGLKYFQENIKSLEFRFQAREINEEIESDLITFMDVELTS